jgi:hypothetical protein
MSETWKVRFKRQVKQYTNVIVATEEGGNRADAIRAAMRDQEHAWGCCQTVTDHPPEVCEVSQVEQYRVFLKRQVIVEQEDEVFVTAESREKAAAMAVAEADDWDCDEIVEERDPTVVRIEIDED